MVSNIIEHPLFQLNLMIFLSWKSPVFGAVHPIFQEAGYELTYIERRFDVPLSARTRLRTHGIEINQRVEPDLFLENSEFRIFIPLECKRSSLSLNSKQLSGILCLTGTELHDLFGKPRSEHWDSVVVLVTVAGHGQAILEELEGLSAVLTSAAVEHAKFATLELFRTAKGVHLGAVPRSAPLPGLDTPISTLVMELDEGEDPRTLYLIPYLGDSTYEADEKAEMIFKERLKLAVVVMLGRLRDREVIINLDMMIEQTVQVWPLWRSTDRTKNIRDYVRQFLRQIFGELRSNLDIDCRVVNRDIILPSVSEEQADDVRKYIRNKPFRQEEITLSGPVQTHLDDITNV